MRKISIQLVAFFVSAMFICGTAIAQPFEGVIEFKRATSIDTTDYVYYVKGNIVRIDEIGTDGKVAGTMLVNIKEYKAQSLSPERKLYMDLESTNKQFIKLKDVNVTKGKKTKMVAGYKCEEWIVTKKDQNTIITYYLAKDNFDFFEGLLIALNRKDKLSTYYQQLPETKSVFPLYSQETDLNGKPKASLETTKITKKTLDKSLFLIPADFKRFEK
jgi:hypothetical protein